MKLTKINILIVSGLLLTSILLVGCSSTAQDQTLGTKAGTQNIKEISPQEAETLIKNHTANDDFAIIDVRTPQEYATGHIPQAINLDYRSQTFSEEIGKLDKSEAYVIYCQSGNRSGKALDVMKGLGFKEVYGITGGITQWSAEGLPIVR